MYHEKLVQKANRPLSQYSCSTKCWSNTWIKHTTGKNKPSLVSAPNFRVTDQSSVKYHNFENCNFYKDLYGERARLICHTKPYNNRNFQIDGASRYFGVWLWQLVHFLILVCSFQWCVLFVCLAKLYRSCPVHDKGLSGTVKSMSMFMLIWCSSRIWIMSAMPE